MDLRGFGDSDRPADVAAYALPNSLVDVGAVVETLGGRVALVSHDWGGAVGWAYTAFSPDNVERSVVMNLPHLNALAERPRNLRQLQMSWYMFFFQFEGVAEEALSRNGYELFRLWFYDTASVKLGDEEIARYIEVFSRPGALTAGLNWYRANQPPASMMAETRQLLPPISRPVMVLFGVDDAYLSFDLAKRSGEFVTGPYAFHAFPDTGHWIQQERPAEVNEKLLEFLGTDFG